MTRGTDLSFTAANLQTIGSGLPSRSPEVRGTASEAPFRVAGVPPEKKCREERVLEMRSRVE
jgi:hypothetical protein